jgi:hypothetical protein
MREKFTQLQQNQQLDLIIVRGAAARYRHSWIFL